MSYSITTQIPTIGSAAMRSASADKTPIGGASREPLSPGNLDCERQPWSAGTGEQSLFFICVWKNDFPNRTHDVRQMTEEVEATIWRLRECIRARELAASHRLGRTSHVQMLEEKKAWKRETGFNRVETIAEMNAERFSCRLRLGTLQY